MANIASLPVLLKELKLGSFTRHWKIWRKRRWMINGYHSTILPNYASRR